MRKLDILYILYLPNDTHRTKELFALPLFIKWALLDMKTKFEASFTKHVQYFIAMIYTLPDK